ncbi:hypothetical protein EUTSA_v10010860mg [Eutrema salsugineum]|uniref:Uncharacterized protein n=1 Tax=Eutrema salsugineum TaxID=72664 RepID=V4NI51_EUTSA|nr:hypothetical protein EUTSA_v10010860mg [Eutrema salsugineum]
MGQVFDKLRESRLLITGKQWRQKQVQAICDRVFDRFKLQTGKANFTFEELYIAVLLVYNDINKGLPGPHFDPPLKDLVKSMMTVISRDCQ